MEKFTAQDGIAIQQEQLSEWKKVLKLEVFQMVKDKCEEENQKVLETEDGYSIFRGDSINVFILNLRNIL